MSIKMRLTRARRVALGIILWIGVFASLYGLLNQVGSDDFGIGKEGVDSTADVGDFGEESSIVPLKKNVSWPLDGLPDFQCVNQRGEVIGKGDLLGEPWIASFIFTRCAGSCPRVASQLRALQDRLQGVPVKLVSFSVQPENDTPEVLAKYAENLGADPVKWQFLTGKKSVIDSLILTGFFQFVGDSKAEKPEPGWEVEHSNNLCLVDASGVVVGRYNSLDEAETLLLRKDVERLVRSGTLDRDSGKSKVGGSHRRDELSRGPLPDWCAALPAVNASLNAIAGVVLVLGVWLVRSGREVAHRRTMVGAFLVSVVFLGCYVAYHVGLNHYTGSHGKTFSGTGVGRAFYLLLLISHVALAVAVPFLAVVTISRGYRKDWIAHRRIARITFPVWLYVSVTGVVIYVILYHCQS